MTMYSIGAMIILAAMVVHVANGNCAFTASPDKGAHTMCSTSEIGRKCFEKVPIYIGKEDQDDIVDQHNLLRQKVASGDQTPYPPAQRMSQLVWDDELAEVAQRWADQCDFNHDKNRDLMTNGEVVQVGQNLGLHNAGPGNTMNYRTGVKNWFYKELDELSENDVQNYQFNMANGHLSQVMWGDTNRVGCGISQYTVKPLEEQDPGDQQTPGPVYLFACNYAPGGNYDNQPVYAIANDKSEAGSKCAQASANYSPLCAPSSGNSAPAIDPSTGNQGSSNSQEPPKHKQRKNKRPQSQLRNYEQPQSDSGTVDGNYGYNSGNTENQNNVNNPQQDNNYRWNTINQNNQGEEQPSPDNGNNFNNPQQDNNYRWNDNNQNSQGNYPQQDNNYRWNDNNRNSQGNYPQQDNNYRWNDNNRNNQGNQQDNNYRWNDNNRNNQGNYQDQDNSYTGSRGFQNQDTPGFNDFGNWNNYKK